MGKLLDELGRFVIEEYATARPFSSFLPGIAGPMGIPLWVFYVNRGQAITSFGLATKDHPIVEFQPANKAYQTTPYTGFRTFIKILREDGPQSYEPFAPWQRAGSTRQHMCIGTNELELQETAPTIGLQTNVLYFTLPGEHFAALVRRVTLRNLAGQRLDLEVLDGLPAVLPFGVKDQSFKLMARTIEAWMEVCNIEQHVPFYRLRASTGDTTQVEAIQGGNFGLSFVTREGQAQLLSAIVDPTLVFGHNTALSAPNEFNARSLAELSQRQQITSGRTPCGFFAAALTLPPEETITLHAIFGHTHSLERLSEEHHRLLHPSYIRDKWYEAQELTRQLTAVVATHTSSPFFDAYCRQTFLDNVLRGGWPVLLGDNTDPVVYHIYSRKHGDPERDYNYFYMAPEFFSQGNGNYRDVNQNRRNDVLLQPQVGAFNVLSFLGLVQADGYNPLVVEGSRFSLAPERRSAILDLVERPEELAPLLTQPFTPGGLLRAIADGQIALKVSAEEFVAAGLTHAEQHFEATSGEGYWIDHWTYNLDLIETCLAVYPDRKDDLLFGRPTVPFFDSPAIVQPRARKYALASDGRVHQYGAVVEDEAKAALIAGRTESPNLVRTARGKGEVYRTTVFAKLVGLALLKFATLDPLGIGVEMEAGKPGWYDALNGLPGLLGSSLCETYELERLLTFLLEAMAEKAEQTVDMPIEQAELLDLVVEALQVWCESDDPDRDLQYWDVVAAARETYRARVRLGFGGEREDLPFGKLAAILATFRAKVRTGIQRAVEMNHGIPPSYFTYTVTDYDLIPDADGEPRRDEQDRPYVRAKCFEPTVLPLFLEGPMHALKVQPDLVSARDLYAKIRKSDLYDRKLGMYKVNASLEAQSHEIGRVRAFTPGWLENESVWLHMEYKYLLEVLRAGLYEEFYDDFERTLICFQDPEVYGRSPLENSSFLVSSAHPDESLHGAGFVARLSGATAEFLSIWTTMMAGQRPFFLKNGKLCLAFRPTLPGWLFDREGRLTFNFLGDVRVTYHNPGKLDIHPNNGMSARPVILHSPDQSQIEFTEGIIGEPYARMVRAGQIAKIDVYLQAHAEFHR